jgi:uncharacterized membrane protein HdeD (DUF308 family)
MQNLGLTETKERSMRLFRLIFGVFAILFGAFELYVAYLHHREFMQFLIGGLFMLMGILFLVVFSKKSQQ